MEILTIEIQQNLLTMERKQGMDTCTNSDHCKVIRVNYTYNHIQVRPAYRKQG